MLEEGSKPRPGPVALAGAGRGGSAVGWLRSPWLPTAAALLGAGGLGSLILVAAWPNGPPELWPLLVRQYWLIGAVSVLICLGFGTRIQVTAYSDLLHLRISGTVVLGFGADAAVLAAALVGLDDTGQAPIRIGIAAFFLADGIVAAGLLGRRLMAGPRRTGHLPASGAAPTTVVVEPGTFVPFDGVVVSGRSEIDDGPIGGSALAALRGAGDVVRRGARNGDGRLMIEALVEPPLRSPHFAAAPMFPKGFDAYGGLVLVLTLGIAIIGSLFAAPTQRFTTALLLFAIVTPLPLGLVRPLVYAKARRLAASSGWRLNGTEAIERLADVNALVCGRGGVVTRTQLEIVALHPAVNIEADELVAAGASLAQSSHGFWARILLHYAVARKMRLAPLAEWSDEIDEFGIGLRARTQGGQVLVAGPREWIEEQGIRTHFLESEEQKSLMPGRRSLWVAQLSPLPILIGVLVAGERLKPGASEMCKNAKRFGLIGALLDRRDIEGGAELARYLGLRVVEDDAMARKAMATEWDTIGLRAAIAQHRGDPAPEAPTGPRLLLGSRPAFGEGGWTAATEREDPRLIMDLLRLARETRRRERLGYLLAYVFCVPGLWSVATGQDSVPILALAAAVGLLGVVANAQLLGLVPWTATEIDEE